LALHDPHADSIVEELDKIKLCHIVLTTVTASNLMLLASFFLYNYFFYYYYYYLVCEAIGTAATPGLLCQPRVIMKMIVEKQMECRVAGETEVLEETCPSPIFGPSQNPI
jgi:hypothetical protein